MYIMKKHLVVADPPPVIIYANKKENRITFTIKNEYYLELLMSETLKLLRSTENKIAKDKSSEDVC